MIEEIPKYLSKSSNQISRAEYEQEGQEETLKELLKLQLQQWDLIENLSLQNERSKRNTFIVAFLFAFVLVLYSLALSKNYQMVSKYHLELLDAIPNGNVNVVRELIKKDYNANLQDGYGQMSLHILCQSQFEFSLADQILMLLIEHGTNLDIQNTNGDTPLILCIRKGHYDLAQRLIDMKTEKGITNKQGLNALDVYIESFASLQHPINITFVKSLIDEMTFSDVNHVIGPDGSNVVTFLYRCNKNALFVETIIELIKAGTNPNKPTTMDGQTMLMNEIKKQCQLASMVPDWKQSFDSTLLDFLLSSDEVLVNTADSLGKTPLMLTCTVDVFDKLIAKKADFIYQHDHSKSTVLDIQLSHLFNEWMYYSENKELFDQRLEIVGKLLDSKAPNSNFDRLSSSLFDILERPFGSSLLANNTELIPQIYASIKNGFFPRFKLLNIGDISIRVPSCYEGSNYLFNVFIIHHQSIPIDDGDITLTVTCQANVTSSYGYNILVPHSDSKSYLNIRDSITSLLYNQGVSFLCNCNISPIPTECNFTLKLHSCL